MRPNYTTVLLWVPQHPSTFEEIKCDGGEVPGIQRAEVKDDRPHGCKVLGHSVGRSLHLLTIQVSCYEAVFFTTLSDTKCMGF